MPFRSVRWALLVALLSCLPCLRPLGAEPQTADPQSKRAAVAVCMIMQEGHLTRRPIDDDLSRRCLHRFLTAFDPMKLYFLESDVNEFSALETRLDELVPTGDLAFGFTVCRRFLERADARAEWAAEFAAAPMDFKADGQVILDPDSAHYAKDDTEARARWRDRVRFDVLSMIVDGTPEPEARERIAKRYRNSTREWHKLKDDEIVELYLNALTTGFDPHSSYMSPTTLQDFRIQLELSLEGIGAVLSNEDGTILVKEVVPGGAADQDGRLKPGDKLTAVGQDDAGELVDIAEMRLRDAVKLIRGKAGTRVRLEVVPAKSQKREVYAMTRQKVELRDRAAKGEVVETPGAAGQPAKKIGVIKLPSFYGGGDAPTQPGAPEPVSATEDVRKLLRGFREQQVDAVIFDLRTNGGGLLHEAIGISGLFIDEGPVVQIKDQRGRVGVRSDLEPGVAWSGPLVVLVSRFTASASEIVAGAVQDYARGLVVGDRQTHGKGTVQQILDLEEMLPDASGTGALKITLQQFYRPGGASTQNHGVAADIVLPSWTDHDNFGEAKLEYALEFDRVPAAKFAPARTVTGDALKTLQDRATARLAAESDLQDAERRKRGIHERMARKVFTYNEAILRKDHDETSEEDRKAGLTDPDDDKEPKFGTTAFTRESLRIAADLVEVTANATPREEPPKQNGDGTGNGKDEDRDRR